MDFNGLDVGRLAEINLYLNTCMGDEEEINALIELMGLTQAERDYFHI